MKFDINSAESIISFAKALVEKTLHEMCGKEIEDHG